MPLIKRPSLSWKWLSLIALYRLLNASLVRTYFDPDEFWQGPEIAHCFSYNYGHLAWEWQEKIRGFFHPLVFALFYELVKFLGVDSPSVIAWVPRVPQALLLAASDASVYSLATRLFGKRVGKWALFSQLTNWFVFFAGVRTLSNSMEMTLVVIAMSYWPWPGKQIKYGTLISVLIGGLSILVRPTAITFWALIGLHLLITMKGGFSGVARLLLIDVIPAAVFIGALSFVVDYWFFGEWVLPPLQFVFFNVSQSISELYGTHPWHWYFSQGFWTILGAYAPIFVYGVWKGISKSGIIVGVIVWVNFVFSLNPHKEFRFVFPVLPLALIMCGYAWDKIYPEDEKKSDKPRRRRKHSNHKLLIALLVVQIAMAVYFSTWHQYGPIGVTDYLRSDASDAVETNSGCIHAPITGTSINDTCQAYSIWFLLPCHSTPYYSRIHRNVPMKFLDCSPLYVSSDQN